MKRRLQFAFSAFSLLLGGAAFGQTYQPLSVTGFTEDVIANGEGIASGSTTKSVDGSINEGANFAFHSKDYQLNAEATPPTYGLPIDGVLTSPNVTGLTYALMPYTGNNSLRLANQNSSGTLTLATPAAASTLYLAASSGDGGSTISVQVNFADGTSQTVTGLPVTNWDSAAPAATPAIITNIGRVKRTTGITSTGNFKLFQLTVPVSLENQAKLINSLTITKTSTGTESNIANIFAVSAQLLGQCPSMGTVSATANSLTSATFSWTLGTLGTGGTAATYTLEVATDAEFATPVAGSPFTDISGTSQVVTGLATEVTYYYRVKADNGVCESEFMTGNFKNGYCVPSGSSTYFISNVVTTGGFTNISNATGATQGGYSNYAATQIVTQIPGGSFDITLNVGSSTHNFFIWVDWNSDLDFNDPGETLVSTNGYLPSYSGTINIPANQPAGSYRMRVANSYIGTVSNACGPATYAEFEDYTIAVGTKPADCVAPDAPTVAASDFTTSGMTITVTPPASTATGYLIVRSTATSLTATPETGINYPAGSAFGGGIVVASGTGVTATDFTPANSQYNYFVYAYKTGGTECFGPVYSSTAATTSGTTCALAAVASGASNIGNNSAVVNYNSVAGNNGATPSYTIQVSESDNFEGELVGTFTSDTNSYKVTGLDIATTYYFRVKAETTGCDNADWSASQSFTTQSIYSPIAVTGFNADVIANGNGIANLSTTNAVDAVDNAYIALNYKSSATANVTNVGLPVNRRLTNSGIDGLSFVLADYTGNNSLRLPAQNEPGTLTFTEPLQLSILYLALTSGSNGSTISVQINFEDGTNQLVSGISVLDWYAGATAASPALISGIGRANRSNTVGNVETGASKIFYVTVPVDGENQSKAITSLTITKTSAGAASPVPNIFAVSGKLIDQCPKLNLAFTMGTADGATVSFGLLPDSSPASSYIYEVYTDEAYTTEVEGSPFTSETTSLTVTGLDAATTYYYRAKASNGTCESSYITGSFTTLCETPAAPAAEAQSFCTGATVADLEATATDNNTLKWYTSNTAPTALAATAALATGTYYVSQTAGTCEGPRTAVTVTVNTVTAPVAGNQLSFCAGATIEDITLETAEGATVTWSATQDGEAIEVTTELATGTYYVTQTVGECTSTATAIAVTVNPLPAAPTADAQSFCGTATVAELEATTAEGATLTWYATENGPALEGTAALATGTYYFTQTVNGCVSPVATVAVTVTNVTAPVAAAQTFCTGATAAELEATATEGATLTWYATQGGDAITEGTVLVTGTYYVTQTIGECTSTATPVAVTVNTIPNAPEATDTQSFEQGETVADLEVTLAEGATATWYILDEDAYVEIPETTVLTNGTTYYVSQSNGNCESERTAVTANLTSNTNTVSVRAVVVYPNPATSVLNIQSGESISKLTLINLLGQSVMQQNVSGAQAQLNIDNIAAGTYILQVTAGNKVSTVKVIKQ